MFLFCNIAKDDKYILTAVVGVMETAGNPWNGAAAFTADMKPAHNPNNPFL